LSIQHCKTTLTLNLIINQMARGFRCKSKLTFVFQWMLFKLNLLKIVNIITVIFLVAY